MLGSSGRPDSQVLEVVVPAERALTLLYSQIGPHGMKDGFKVARTCKLPITFTPRRDEQYEVRYRYAADVEECSVAVFRLLPASGQQISYQLVEGVIREGDSCSPTVVP
jgi:hypothetical protein